MPELILQRYERHHIIKKTRTKTIQVVVNRNTGQRAVAKLQEAYLMKDSKIRNVLHQASFTQTLQGYRGIPFMIWSGKTKDQKIVLLVQQLGDTLEARFQLCNNKFSAKTVCMLGIQMLQIVKNIHDKGFVITNISFQIFQFGKGDKCLDLYINNLIECMVYRDFNTMAHILQQRQYFRDPAHIFQSGAAYRNQQKSRRDDIESIFLILIYLLKGQLPWSGIFKNPFNKQKYKKINVSPQIILHQFQDSKKICQHIPKVFYDMLQDCRGLQFEQQPPYHWYILKLKSVLYTNNQQHDYVYDWMLLPEFNKSLQLQMRNPCIQLDKDQQFMNYLEAYVFPTIDLDYITNKHSFILKLRKQKQTKQESKKQQSQPQNTISLSPEEQQLNCGNQQQFDSKKSSKLEPSKKGNGDVKGQNVNQVVLNTSILERKKQKKRQCSLM